MASTFRFGIEEEYFLADAGHRGAVRTMPQKFIQSVQGDFPDEVQREMLQSQIEIATPVLGSMDEARRTLGGLRQGLAARAAEEGMLLLACGTHPCAIWDRQQLTDAARYDALMRDLQMIGSRNQFCGLHVHVEVPDEDERIRLMARLMPYLPLLLALSTSSPFWQGRATGLLGYRLAGSSELPRTGLPELFTEPQDYRAYVAALTKAGAIKDASYIWWAIRPSLRHPTLELRVADSCTRVEDTLAVAALYRCLVRHLLRRPDIHARMTPAMRGIAVENMWRAQRYGVHGGLIATDASGMRPIPDLVAELTTELAEDAAALDCRPELARCATLAAEGTSADEQLRVFEQARERGAADEEALAAVVDWIAAATAPTEAARPAARAAAG